MSRYDLKPCRWRRPSSIPGRQGCASPIIRAGPFGVCDHQCWMCPELNHLDPAQVANHSAEVGQVRHLAFHCYPLGQFWRWHMRYLRDHMSLFNGLRLMGVAVGPETATLADVDAELAGLGVELFEVPNQNGLREMTTYPLLMERLCDYRSPADCHFYGHTKGVATTAWGPAAATWAEAMYEALLEHWPAVERELRDACCVGIFKRDWQGPVKTRARWHYSGSFRWCRNNDFFARDWRMMDPTWLASETHVGLLFGHVEASCLYGEFATQDCGLYAESEWRRWAQPRREAWLAARVADRRRPLLATVILTAHRQPELVHQAIASVLGQTSSFWRLVIVDSGPLAAAGAYERYRGLANVSVETTGETADWPAAVGRQAWAINRAVAGGRGLGDVLCCLSDDDLFHPNWLDAVLKSAELHPEQAAWYGTADLAELLSDGGERRLGRLQAGHVAGRGLPLRGRIDGMQVAVRRSAWVPWPEPEDSAAEADGHWMDALAEATAIYPLAASAGTHRRTPLSTFTRSTR